MRDILYEALRLATPFQRQLLRRRIQLFNNPETGQASQLLLFWIIFIQFVFLSLSLGQLGMLPANNNDLSRCDKDGHKLDVMRQDHVAMEHPPPRSNLKLRTKSFRILMGQRGFRLSAPHLSFKRLYADP